jgi:hypothetical protein
VTRGGHRGAPPVPPRTSHTAFGDLPTTRGAVRFGHCDAVLSLFVMFVIAYAWAKARRA